ncbi:MAG: hypothetical protein J4G13_04405 [Dehalococcoidia bacterium]|nr:hypothetical protein [Dehalococcoidia bacterium]
MAERQTEPQTITCHWHPTVPTGLSCSQCRRPICTECMVQAPVGIRCRECGRPVPLPTFDVRPSNYAKALVVGAVLAVLGVILWLTLGFFTGTWFLSLIVTPLAVGYAAGEIISRVVNLKRSKGLMYIAGGTVVLTTLFAMFMTSGLVLSLWGILALIGGVLIAIARVRL